MNKSAESRNNRGKFIFVSKSPTNIFHRNNLSSLAIRKASKLDSIVVKDISKKSYRLSPEV